MPLQKIPMKMKIPYSILAVMLLMVAISATIATLNESSDQRNALLKTLNPRLISYRLAEETCKEICIASPIAEGLFFNANVLCHCNRSVLLSFIDLNQPETIHLKMTIIKKFNLNKSGDLNEIRENN